MTTYILIIVFTSGASYGGVETLTQEFSTKDNCEVARVSLVKAHDGNSVVIKSQGCYRK